MLEILVATCYSEPFKVFKILKDYTLLKFLPRLEVVARVVA